MITALSGRDLSELGFDLALGYSESAVICEGIHHRYRQGQTVGEGFDTVGPAAGLESIEQGGRR